MNFNINKNNGNSEGVRDELNFDSYQEPSFDDILEYAKNHKEEIDFSQLDFGELLKKLIVDDSVFTVSMNYDAGKEECTIAVQGVDPICYKKIMDSRDYLDLCKVVHIEENDDYNMSESFMESGKRVRAFALTKPLSKYPNITISSVKDAPLNWHQIELEKILPVVAKESFLIVGASGAGKTYFMNYMIKECHKNSQDKIGIIEEFDELIRPNDATCKIVIPPRKPGKDSLLQFITEQSNLMRLKYLYVGEIKGPEAWPFVNNLASGTIGGATIHGESVTHGLQRLKSLCMLTDAPEKAIEEGIAKSLKYVIYLENHNVMEIRRLTSVSMNGNFSLQDVWKNPRLAKIQADKKRAEKSIVDPNGQSRPMIPNEINEYNYTARKPTC